MTKKKERVMILTNIANTKYLDNDFKEQLLKNYCKNKNYKVVDYMKCDGISLLDVADNIVDFCINSEFKKLVIFSIDEIAENIEELLSIYTILKEFGIEIQSINDGIIGKDKTFKVNLYYSNEFIF